MAYLYILIVVILNVSCSMSDGASEYVTQTVYGFLDFTTTIENTVMVFSPQSAPALDLQIKTGLPLNAINTKPVTNKNSTSGIKPTKPTNTNNIITDSNNEAVKESTTKTIIIASSKTQTSESKQHVDDTKDIALQIENNIYQPEYDLLSRQPVEYAEETYRVVNLKTRIRNHENNRARNTVTKSSNGESSVNRPIGLVTKLSASDLKNGITTFYETSVIGTYISGKYAQVLQSSSNIHKNDKPRIQPTSSLRVLKTVAPILSKPIQAKLSASQVGFSNRKRSKNTSGLDSKIASTESSNIEIITERTNNKKNSSRTKSKRRNKGSRISTKKSNHHQPITTTSPEVNRRSFKPKVQTSNVDTETTTSFYTFKLNRTPGRWQYKTSPKPRVNIRKPVGDAVPNTPSTINNDNVSENTFQNSILYQGDLESSSSQNGPVLNNVEHENSRKMFVETLNVEISTAPNAKDTYYEIATIKTPYTFQAGVLKKTRYITVTSTFEKVFQPESTSIIPNGEPLTQNILEPSISSRENIALDTSIITLNPIHITNNIETPILETITESFSITHVKLKTQLLPIIREEENKTSYATLVQTYDFTSLITVTRTFPPLDGDQFIPSLNFKDFSDNLDEAGSEMNLELEFGDEDNSEVLHNGKKNQRSESDLRKPDLNIVSDRTKTTSSTLNPNFDPESIQQLALLNLLKSTTQLSTVLTTSRPFIKVETLWESHVVPIVNSGSSIYRTLSKSVGTITKTEYHLDTTTVQLPPVQQNPLSLNPFLLPLQQFQTITTPVILQTIGTHTHSKILKLTFGAKTAYTTIYSTEVMPTALTTFITTSLPVQPTAGFPGYFPPPYPYPPYIG